LLPKLFVDSGFVIALINEADQLHRRALDLPDHVEVVGLSPERFARALVRYKTHRDKEWSLVDCVSFEVMEQRGIRSALAYDRHFVQAGFEALLRD